MKDCIKFYLYCHHQRKVDLSQYYGAELEAWLETLYEDYDNNI